MKKSAGMSLMEILIAISIASVLIFAGAYLVQQFSRMQIRQDTLTAVQSELGLLRLKLTKVENCAAIFGDMKLDPTSGVQTVVDTAVKKMDLKFSAFDHVNWVSTQILPRTLLEKIVLNPATVYGVYSADLLFDFQPQMDVPGGSLAVRQLPIHVLLNTTTQQIVSCQADLGDIGTYCKTVGGTYDPAKTPPCQLPVFVLDCPPSKVAKEITPSGFDCVTPPVPPDGDASKPTPKFAIPFVQTKIVSCPSDSDGSCSCPPGYPIPSSSSTKQLTCVGYSSVPPAHSLADVENCVAAAAKTDSSRYCLKLDGDVVSTGFGPCMDCP